nr:dockerin type I domain-containing protein [Acetivibrio thermocellus]THJ78755.1 dockerin [Acetivibrio thermocellus]
MKKKSFISAALIVFLFLSFCLETPNIGAVSAQNAFEDPFVHLINSHLENCETSHEEICDSTGNEGCEVSHEEICDCTGNESCEAGHEEISDSDEHKACKAGHEACSCKCTSDSDKDNTISNLDMNDIEPVGNALFVEKNEENLSNIVTYASLSSVVLAASCSHQFNGSYTVTKEPTCTTTGTKVGKCTKCGAIVSTVTIPALGHSYGSWTVTKAATCTTDGSQKRTCSRCKNVETQTIKATGHTFNGSYTVTKEATCTTTGTKVGKCTKCGATVSTVTIPALGHSYGSWTVTKAATCTTAGTEKRTCTRSGCTASETRSISATGHTFNGSYTVTKEATCTTAGTKVGKCTKCGTTVSTVEIPALGHSYGSWTVTKAATCTTAGTEKRTCTRSGCTASETRSISATGHTFNGSYTTIKEPTCTTTGTKVGKCTKCGEVVSSVEIKELGHDFGSWKTIKQATCTEKGLREGTCSRCSVRKTEEISPTGHQFNGSFTTVKEPTCTEEGLKVGKCTKCGEVVTTAPIPALGGAHQFNGSFTTVKEPTCTEKGLKEGRCTRCGATVTTTPIPELGHDFGSWKTIKEATCTEKGLREGTCSRCSVRKTEEISPTGHQFNGSFTTVKEPTCTEEGLKVGKCTKCGEEVATAPIPALGGAHQFNGSFTTVKKPTCTDPGLAEGRCSRCKTVVATKEIPPLGGSHQFNGSYKIIKEATCTEEGLKEGRCTKCGTVISTSVIPPQHKFSKITITPDRITLGGSNATESPIYVKVVCSKCNTTVDVTSKAKFSSSNSNVASVVNGYVKSGTQFGTATITADYDGMKAVCSVQVKPAGGEKLRALCITPKEDTIAEFNKWGSQVKVMAVYDDYEVDITDYVLFTSGDRNIAYVDEYYGNKYIKSGTKKGTTLITASYEGKKDTCTVKVDMAYEVEEMPFKLGKETNILVPEDLPVIGGTEVEFSFDHIPGMVKYGEKDFRIAIGIEDKESLDKKWDNFVKYFEDAKNSKASAKELRNRMKKLGSKKGSFSIKDDWEPEVEAYGYIEGVFINGIPVATRGSFAVIVEAEYRGQKQYFIGPVPVYFEIAGGLEMELISDILRVDFETGRIMLNSELKVTPRFELGAGVGLVKVLTVGGSGEAELEFLIITGSEDYLKVTLTGSLKLKVSSYFFSAEKEIAKGTWVLYESKPRLRMASPNINAQFDLYNADEYKMMPRDYIERPSEWLGNRRLMRSMATGFTNKELKVLGTNIYPDAQPQLVNLEDKQVLVWIADNPDRTSANRTMLVYSVYDKNSGIWSEPVAVDDDGTADFYPQLAVDGNDLYVVWQNSNKTFAEDVTLEEVVASSEIAVSKFDEVTGTFGAAVRLTENDVVDMLPQIIVSDGNAYIVWFTNNKNDVFGVDGENSIYYCELKDNEWSSPELLSEGLNAIVSISAGFIEGSFAVAYALDGDDMLETIDDMEIYIVKPGDKDIRITDNDTMDSAPVFSSFNGEGALYWYNEGNILYITQIGAEPNRVFSESKPGLKDNFKVVEGSNGETAIIWTNTAKGSSTIFTAIYDEDRAAWSDVVKLSDVTGQVQSPDGVFDDEGNFSIAFSRLSLLEDGNEQADLCIIKVVPSYNLSIDSVNFDHSKVIPGTQLAIDVEVTNNGEIGVEELVVDILDGDEIINSEAVQISLKPGESKTATVLMNLPDTIAKKAYSIRVSTVEGEEYNTDDNVKQFTIGYTDISLQLEIYSEGDIEYVTANIINLSHVPTGATLKVTKGSEDGEVIDTKVIDSTDDIVKYEYQFDKKILCADKETEILYFTVVADEEEIYTSDNTRTLVLSVNNDSTDKTTVSGYISVDFDYPPESESKIKSGFNVKVAGTELSTKTDEKGYFEISGIPGDMREFTLEISKRNYLKRNVTVNGTGKLVVSTEDNPLILWAGDVERKGVQDNAINMVDVMEISKVFGTRAGDEEYVAELDLNMDGAINLFDIAIVIRHFNALPSRY